MKQLVFCATMLVMGAHILSADVLTWQPEGTATWSPTATNWLTSTGNRTAWIAGSDARFTTNGCIVAIDGEINANALLFEGTGVTLGGAGRLTLTGSIVTSAGTTNSISTELYATQTIEKSGAGALCVGACLASLQATEGTLIAASSQQSDAMLTVKSGAQLTTWGEPAQANNLLANGSFENYLLSANSWKYVRDGAQILPWVVTVHTQHVGLVYPSGGTEWTSGGSIPHGVQALILQYNGRIEQTATVTESGWYSVSFTHWMRRGYYEHAIYVSLDNTMLTAVINDAPMLFAKRFVSVPCWLSAGTHTLAIQGEGEWTDRTSILDLVCLGQPSSSTACAAFGGDSEVLLENGASATLSHAGTLSPARLVVDPGATISGGGTWSAATDLTWYDFTTLWNPTPANNVNGLLRIRSALSSLPITHARRIWFSGTSDYTLASATLTLTNNTAATRTPRISVSDNRTVTLPLTLSASRTNLTLDTFGTLNLTGATLEWLANRRLSKFGPGKLLMPNTATNLTGVHAIYEGEVVLPHIQDGTYYLQTLPGRSGTLRINSLFPNNGSLSLAGTGPCKLTTDQTSVFFNNSVALIAPKTEIDVPSNSTMSIIRLTANSTSRGVQPSDLIKSGAGLLELRSNGFGTDGLGRTYAGSTTIRNGALRILGHDTGNFTGTIAYNNIAANATVGGVLGSGPLTNTVHLGDSGTLPTDAIQFIVSGSGLYVGHDFSVNKTGASVAFHVTNNTTSTMFGGTLTLHQDATFVGPTATHLALTKIVFADDYEGTHRLNLDGFALIQVDGSLPATMDVDLGTRSLRMGANTITTPSLRDFTVGTATTPATLEVEFEAGLNDTLAVRTFTVNKLAFKLLYRATTLNFVEPGTYTLLNFESFSGDVANLSVANPQPGLTYQFATTASALTLTIGVESSNPFYSWINPASGEWLTSGNWYNSQIANTADAVAYFGSVLTNASTITLTEPITLSSLYFNHGSYSYTVAGQSINVTNIVNENGNHTLQSDITSDTLALNIRKGSLTLRNATLSATVQNKVGSTILANDVTLNNALDVSAGAITVTGTNVVVGALSSGAGTVALSGSGARLTTLQNTATELQGPLTGTAGTFVKTGTATLTLRTPGTTFSGTTRLDAGSTVLAGASLMNGAILSDTATLELQPVSTNGLMGYFYALSPTTNAFTGLATLDAMIGTTQPSLIAPSSSASTNFDYPPATGSSVTLPAPFGAGGANQNNFTAVWRGSITLPDSGPYTFGILGDDCFLFAIDNQALISSMGPTNSYMTATATLDAGRHDILIALGQLTTTVGLRVQVKAPSMAAAQQLPNAWLSPAVTVRSVTGNGVFNLSSSTVSAQIGNPSGTNQLSAQLAGVSGARLTKIGNSTLNFAPATATAFAGSLAVQEGTLAFTTANSLSADNPLSISPRGTVLLNTSQRIGGLSGQGTLATKARINLLTFTGDADSGISSSKTYTHLVDFATNSTAPTINGVTFNNRGAWAFTQNPLSNSWNVADVSDGWGKTGDDTTRTGINALTWDFVYNNQNWSMELYGLTPGKTYEYRFYYRNFKYNDRTLTFNFYADSQQLGAIVFNADSISKTEYGCLVVRYVAPASGTLRYTCSSKVSTDTCHLYGFSNEEIPDTEDGAPVLVVAPPQNTEVTFAGALNGTGSLIKRGTGHQKFSGINTLSDGLRLEAGNVSLLPGARVQAPVCVTNGSELLLPAGAVTLGGLTGNGAVRFTNVSTNLLHVMRFDSITNDASTGISSNKVYTHLIDFGLYAPTTKINNVTFTKVSASITSWANGYGWQNFPSGTHGGGSLPTPYVPTGTGIYTLLYAMNYGMVSNSFKLTNLQIGHAYELCFYSRRWQSSNLDRTQTLIIQAGGVTTTNIFNPDAMDPTAIRYAYIAQSTELSVRINPKALNQTFHIYGLSNEDLGLVSTGPVLVQNESDTTFAGTLSGTQTWIKSGTGALVMSGINTAAGDLIVSNGAFGVAASGVASAGAIYATSNTLLFGAGTLATSAYLLPGSALQAGTSAACGVLIVTSNLAISAGTTIQYRYASTTLADNFVCNGMVTLPESGRVVALPLAGYTGKPPAGWPLITSATPIQGPLDFSTWTIQNLPRAKLVYSADKCIVYLLDPRGTLLFVR